MAGISPTWYRYLEQGRSIQPSAQVLDALARVLLLTEDERRHLHLLGSRTPETEQPLIADPLVAAHGNDPRVRARLDEFREWWDQHGVQLHRSRTSTFDVPGRRREAVRIVVVQAPEFVPWFVVFHVPV